MLILILKKNELLISWNAFNLVGAPCTGIPGLERFWVHNRIKIDRFRVNTNPNTNPRQLINKHCSASEYAFFFDTERVQLL